MLPGVLTVASLLAWLPSEQTFFRVVLPFTVITDSLQDLPLLEDALALADDPEVVELVSLDPQARLKASMLAKEMIAFRFMLFPFT